MAQKGTVVKVAGASGHTFTREEVEGIVDHLNHALDSNPAVRGYLPVNGNSDDIFSVVADGVILSYS
jgi:protein-disulfide isomerase-like protein with CxxC motif